MDRTAKGNTTSPRRPSTCGGYPQSLGDESEHHDPTFVWHEPPGGWLLVGAASCGGAPTLLGPGAERALQVSGT